MENIFVEFLPPWVETGIQPAFYDKESGTVLQQTARMYARVNMLIRMFNKLSKETKEIVEEYITKFNDLHDYVHDYFDNLDVQEEINNKLDDMVEQGTLQEIITSYIQANVAWAFDTVADMKSATNLVAGSYAQTLGFHTLNDGGGATYYITDSGTADEMEVIAVGDLYANLVLPEIVTPEIFGAYGDGTHDDSNAWNKAVSIKRDVKSFDKTYAVGKIDVRDNINIDCGNAKFICSADRLFDIEGELVTSLANENNYSANDTTYHISNVDHTTYTGYAFIHGDNNFEQSRDYYLGGFACSFYEGEICEGYPIPVTNTVIDLINPIVFTLKNIGNITHVSPTENTRSIYVLYGLTSNISNIHISAGDSFSDIYLDKCMNIQMNLLDIKHESNVYSNTNYIINISDSSYTVVDNSHLHSINWHCYTTGGRYLAYKNTVQNSVLNSDNRMSLVDHADALGTTVMNCTASCIGLSGLSTVKDCIINTTSWDSDGKRCYIRLGAISIEDNATYNIEGITLVPESDVSFPYCGITIKNSPQELGNTYYVKELNLKNINVYGDKRANTYVDMSGDTGGTYYIEKVTIDNCDMDIELKRTTDTQVDMSKNITYISNIRHELNDGGTTRKTTIGINTTDVFGDVYVSDSEFKNIIGVYANLNLHNIKCDSNISSASVTGLLSGSNLRSRINATVIVGAGNVQIDSMIVSGNTRWFNICKVSNHYWCQTLDSGSYVAYEITA